MNLVQLNALPKKLNFSEAKLVKKICFLFKPIEYFHQSYLFFGVILGSQFNH
jgi:hypothetical protein